MLRIGTGTNRSIKEVKATTRVQGVGMVWVLGVGMVGFGLGVVLWDGLGFFGTPGLTRLDTQNSQTAHLHNPGVQPAPCSTPRDADDVRPLLGPSGRPVARLDLRQETVRRDQQRLKNPIPDTPCMAYLYTLTPKTTRM